MRSLAKKRLLSYGYLMGMLWVSYGKDRERTRKGLLNGLFLSALAYVQFL